MKPKRAAFGWNRHREEAERGVVRCPSIEGLWTDAAIQRP
jgi:hypothetical protein